MYQLCLAAVCQPRSPTTQHWPPWHEQLDGRRPWPGRGGYQSQAESCVGDDRAAFPNAQGPLLLAAFPFLLLDPTTAGAGHPLDFVTFNTIASGLSRQAHACLPPQMWHGRRWQLGIALAHSWKKPAATGLSRGCMLCPNCRVFCASPATPSHATPPLRCPGASSWKHARGSARQPVLLSVRSDVQPFQVRSCIFSGSWTGAFATRLQLALC